MAFIRKIENGYRAEIYKGRDENNKKIMEYITHPSHKEIKALARAIEQELENSTFVSINNTWFSVYVDKWIELRKNSLAPQTYLSYKMYINHHFKPFFKDKKLSKINEIHIKEYINTKLETLSINTVRKHFFTLNSIFRDALREKRPTKYIELPKPKKYTPVVPSETEFMNLHAAVKNTFDEIIILLAAWCGLRVGEIFALEYKDFDFTNNLIKISHNSSLDYDGTSRVNRAPKSNAGYREIVIPSYLAGLIKKYITELKIVPQRIFKITPHAYSCRFPLLLEKLGIKKINFHSLRHYHASILYKNGVPDHYAAKRLGHDINVLKGIYQHLDLTAEKKYDESIDVMFNSNT